MARLMPLSAGFAHVLPPRANWGAVAVVVKEDAAENATTKNLTQRRKAARTQSKMR